MNRLRPSVKRVTRSALGLVSGRSTPRLSVLIYHRVLQQRDPLRPNEPTADEFRWQMELVSALFNVLPLNEAVERLIEGRLPPRPAAVTFDDGYADNLRVAYPILEELRVPATVFVATGFLDGGRMFNDTVVEAVRAMPDETIDLSSLNLGLDQKVFDLTKNHERLSLVSTLLPRVKYMSPDERSAILVWLESFAVTPLPTDLMMAASDVRYMHASGVEIGAHTRHHPILSRIDRESAFKEITQSKRDLETLIGAPIRLFAYPNGKRGEDYTQIHVDQVREAGFEAAVTTHPGAAQAGTDRFQIPRFTPWDRTPPRFALRMALNVAGWVG